MTQPRRQAASVSKKTDDAPEMLRRRFDLAHTQVDVAGRQFTLLRPGNIDDLLDEEEFNIDERIPYWAECWPSARILAARISATPGERRKLLELGCGIGLVSLTAAAAGYRVLATDYYAEALEFTSANAARHGLAGLDTRLVDWRKLPEDLEKFDVVVASDVLYEKPQAALVAGAFAHTLARQGRGLLTDPGRRSAAPFVDECSQLGLAANCIEQVPTRDGDTELTVSVYEIRWV